MSDVTIVGPNGVKAVMHDDGSITYPAGAGPTGRRAEAGMAPRPPSERMSDDQLGINAGPIHDNSDTRTTLGKILEQPRQHRYEIDPKNPAQMRATSKDPNSGFDNDPIAHEIATQAMLMPALHVAGLGVSALGRKLLSGEGGKAAELLRSRGLPIKPGAEPVPEIPGGADVLNPEAIVKGGPYDGQKVGEALAKLRRLEANGADVGAQIEHVAGQAPVTPPVAPDPAIAAARETLKFKGPHGVDALPALMGAPLLHVGHGIPALAPAAMAMMARNAAPLAARVAGPALEAAGAGMAQVPMSPLMQAVMGRGE
jgi:hypothetical protein